MFREESVPWAAYGEYSGFYIFTNPDKVAIDPERFDASPYDIGVMKRSSSGPVIDKLRLALLINGVDLSNKAGGSVSAVHSAQDIDATVAAFRAAVRSMKDEGDIA